MAYIGNTPAESYASFETETFTVSATANYTLSHAVTNENEIRLVINGVVQQPGSGKAYTASGTTLTLSSATVSGDSMYAVYLGRALQTVNPPNASVGNSQTAPTIITGQTAETSIATDDTILIHDTSASALRKMTRANFVSGIGGDNTPAFSAYLSSSQAIADTTYTKIIFQTEDYDTDSAYNTSDGLFTVPSGEGGKYVIHYALRLQNWNTSDVQAYASINGSNTRLLVDNGDQHGDNNTFNTSGVLNLSAGNTVSIYFYQNGGANAPLRTGRQSSYFQAYKLIGV